MGQTYSPIDRQLSLHGRAGTLRYGLRALMLCVFEKGRSPVCSSILQSLDSSMERKGSCPLTSDQATYIAHIKGMNGRITEPWREQTMRYQLWSPLLVHPESSRANTDHTQPCLAASTEPRHGSGALPAVTTSRERAAILHESPKTSLTRVQKHREEADLTKRTAHS